jgi:signal peptidase II
MTGKFKYVYVAGAAAAGIILDQATKLMALRFLHENKDVPVIGGFFDLTLRFNTGAAFSLFASKPSILFFLISLVAIVTLLYFVRQLDADQKQQLIALGAILGGALGNLADRVRLGSVVDFLLLYYKSFAWPAFNVADSLIVVGVFTFLWYNLRQESQKKKKAS